MIVVMEKNASEVEVEQVQERLRKENFQIHLSRGVERTIIGVVGDRSRINLEFLEALPGVEKVVPIMRPFKLTSREFQEEDTVVQVRDTTIGAKDFQIIAGPCAVESRGKYLEIAAMVKESGATMLRGGAFKPRTSPYSFQGLEEEGLKILAEARELTGLPVATEVMDQRSVELVAKYADVLQIGARNMQNFFLLREVGMINKPVILKRGPSATLEEWIM
ncbi:MAG: 3-deoxy-7-phosphoheptulonate synthase, partial [Syntrophomonadaceae bacterium]|nr:3-deoxy-7-phosphoheptulonate synthase [Syntrophomonadaceae bacterium]